MAKLTFFWLVNCISMIDKNYTRISHKTGNWETVCSHLKKPHQQKHELGCGSMSISRKIEHYLKYSTKIPLLWGHVDFSWGLRTIWKTSSQKYHTNWKVGTNFSLQLWFNWKIPQKYQNLVRIFERLHRNTTNGRFFVIDNYLKNCEDVSHVNWKHDIS